MSTELPPIITWNDDWLIGQEEIDLHHKTLVDMIQTLFGALITTQGKDYINKVFVELVEYTKYHFKREEELFEEHGFDQLERQKNLHQTLVTDLLGISQTIIAHGSSEETSEEVYDFLKHWLIDHIIEEDLKFKVFLAGK